MDYAFVQINIAGEIFGSVSISFENEEEMSTLLTRVERQVHNMSDDEFWQWVEDHPNVDRFFFDHEINL